MLECLLGLFNVVINQLNYIVRTKKLKFLRFKEIIEKFKER